MKSTFLLPLWIAVFVAAGAAFLPEASGFKEPSHQALLDYDARKARPEQPLAADRAAAVAQLRARIAGLQLDFDEVRGSPKRISAPDGFLSGPSGEGRGISPDVGRALPADDRYPSSKALLNEHAVLFGHGAEVLVPATLKREFVTAHNGLRTVVWEQQLDEIPVYEGLLMGHITKRGELVNLSSQFLPRLVEAANAGTPNRAAVIAAPIITATEALVRAGKSIGEEFLEAAVRSNDLRPEGPQKRQKFKAGQLPGEAQVKLIWLPMDRATLRLCWQVELTRRLGGERFRVLV